MRLTKIIFHRYTDKNEFSDSGSFPGSLEFESSECLNQQESMSFRMDDVVKMFLSI